MFLLILVILEFILIYLLSRGIFSLLFTLFYLPLKHLPAIGSCRRQVQAGQTISNHLVSFLFLPGTVIHEFSHAIVAKLLGAEIGEINVYPHRDKETGEFKAGSIEIEEVDPVRLSLIGIAPSLVGLAILSFTIFYLFKYNLPLDNIISATNILFQTQNYPLFLVIFIISMTMFTSKKDLREFFLVVPFIALVVGLLYYVGFRISLSENLINFLKRPLTSLAFVLGITLIVDLLIYIFLFVPVSLLLSLFGKKLRK